MRSAGQAHPTVLRLASSTPRDRQQVGVSIMSAWTRVRESAFALAKAIAAELRTASTPNLLCSSAPAASCVRRWNEKDVPL